MSIIFDFSKENPCLKCRLVVGIDTVRIGFVPPSMSWELSNRLKTKGWRFFEDRCSWNKFCPSTGLRMFHLPWWVGVEVSLPRLIHGHNSDLVIPVSAAFDSIKEQIDDDLALGAWLSPDIEDWYVNRVDVTADFCFGQADLVSKTLAGLQNARMVYRPRRYNQPHGMKWTTRAGRVSVSFYDKFEKHRRPMDVGKMRLTVGIGGDPNKRQLKKYGMQSVGSLLDNAGGTWLRIIHDEIGKIRSVEDVGYLRAVVDDAIESTDVTVMTKKATNVTTV